MLKKISSVMLMLMCVLGVNAQTPLPLNPQVKHGVLKNGLSYYILHNEEPKERANFYIAQKVGSTLETPEQLGLAHFLEHMAFNGSRNFPGKNMLNYLQDKGIRFGADINAYTAFDETVYNINNVPTTDKPLMDSVLLVLHDWSCDLLLEDEEIDAERGVIQEEWRSRNNANTRMVNAILPQIYDEYQYTRMPIGTMDVVMNFPYNALRDYYQKWYRPDQQGIVIVGDFDADEMEKKVIALFDTIPMPENAAERTYPNVSDNKELKYATFEDSEYPYSIATLSLKYDKIPVELRSTVESYVQTAIFEELVSMMINNRFNELTQKADCPFANASVGFGDFWVSKTKGAFDLTVVAKNDIEPAFKAALAELVRSCKTGFTDSEYQRAKEELLSSFEKFYNERNKTKNENLARELIRAFIDNEPAPGIEVEYQLVQSILSMLPVQAVNEYVKQMLDKENQVLVIAQPAAEGKTLPEKTVMENVLNETFDAEYEAYVDEVITEPLIRKLPKPGKIVKTEELPQFGVTTYTLSNGAKVIVKSTDFSDDEILLTAVREGGKSIYKGEYADDLVFIDPAVASSKLGNFDRIRLSKLYAGKNVDLNYGMGLYTTSVSGKSGKKDLEPMMQLLYAYFTELTPDADSYASTVERYRAMLANEDKNPMKIFREHISTAWYPGCPYSAPLNAGMLDKVNYKNALSIAKKSLENAADYTFIFVGSIDTQTLLPYIKQYIATLPSKGKKSAPSDYIVYQAKGNVVDSFEVPMESPVTTVFDLLSDNNLEYNVYNKIQLEILSGVLTNIFTETLREEEGGTYSPHAFSDFDYYNKEWTIGYNFSTGADKLETINKRAYEETLKLLSSGTDVEHFNKVKEAAYKQYEINSKKNNYWMNNLRSYVAGVDEITGHGEAIQNSTLEGFNNFMKNLYNGKNRIQVIMNGVSVGK